MTTQIPYIHAEWRTTLLSQNLTTVNDWWELANNNADAVLQDDPKLRYGGLMDVHQVALTDSQGQSHAVYIKCQIDQQHRSWSHPLVGLPTLVAECQALNACLGVGVAVAKPLFCDSIKMADGHTRSVLVTLGLTDFQCLNDIDIVGLDSTQRRQLIQDVADAVAWLHQRGYAHRNLYGKHVFAAWRPSINRYEVCFIDMEKTHRIRRQKHWLRDLDTLLRRTLNMESQDRELLVNRYLQQRDMVHQNAKVKTHLLKAGAKKQHS